MSEAAKPQLKASDKGSYYNKGLAPSTFIGYPGRKWQARWSLCQICWSEILPAATIQSYSNHLAGQQVNEVNEKNCNVQSVDYQGEVILVAGA